MLANLLTIRFSRLIYLFVILITLSLNTNGQNPVEAKPSDSSLKVVVDTTKKDSLQIKANKKALKVKVEYSSDDSICFDFKIQKAFLYKNAEINYEKINLKAAYVEASFKNNIAFAKGVTDSTNKETGTPEFKDGDQTFRSKTLEYNFDTKKGVSTNVITKEGEGYLHGSIIKKMTNNTTNAYKGGYTTCDLDHPHYSMIYTKAKVIPDSKIITGPVFLNIEDVTLPVFLPFGLFPNKKGRNSGILIPSYGESANRGFYFENGGYYFGISDYMDLEVRGDIYTRGSYAIKPTFAYKKRYKYSGNFSFNYALNKTGTEGTPDFSKSKDFSIRWTHNQDPKARPNSTFSANVDLQSRKYNQYNPVSANNYLSNTFSSSVAYQTTLWEKWFFTSNLNLTQNTLTKSVTVTLPEISLSTNQFYPFRSNNVVGKTKWYENISVNYKMNARNELDTYDTLLFKPEMFDQFNYGMQHSIPISSSIKLFKHFNLTNTLSFNERWYPKSISEHWVNDTLKTATDTVVGYVRTDTINGFKAAHDFSFSSSLSTKIYGILQFKKGPVNAIRHVITPNIGFSFRPDFADPWWGYYRKVQVDSTGRKELYSIFEDGNYHSLYGTPPSGKSGSINLSLSNNLEMKVRSRKDTVTGTKKIILIDNFTISTSYDLAKDSIKWAPISMNGHTTLFKNLQIYYASVWNLYALDSLGRTINRYEWDVNHRLMRFNNNSWSFSLNWNTSSEKLKNKNKKDVKKPVSGTPEEIDAVNNNPSDYLDWNNSWSLNIAYTFRRTSNYIALTDKTKKSIIQTLSFNGDVSITPKWKFSFNSGYDFENGKFSYTSVNVIRDLHCWEMRFNWIPIGGMKSWNFAINVKSSVLKDLKLTKKKDFRDRWQ